MRLVELMGCRVVDGDGHDIGGVHDVRLIAEGPSDAYGRRSYQLTALVVGDGGAAHRLGYSDDEMRGPWPLTSLFRRSARRSVLVPWEDIASIRRPTIRLRHGHRALITLAEEAERGGKE